SAAGYIKVAVVLFVFTIIEVAVYYIEPIRVLDLLAPVLLFLSVLKFCGIGAWYMHLKMDHKVFFVFFAAGAFLAMGLILTIMALFGEVLEPGKPIKSLSTASTIAFQSAQADAAKVAPPSAGPLPYVEPKSIGNAELGRQFWLDRGCVGCHVAPGIQGGGQIGPNQT